MREKIISSLPSAAANGKTAEQLRRVPGYREAQQVFVSLEPELEQVRINCLVDGKVLVMPSPGLKNGFYQLAPFSVPFRDLGFAVSAKGVSKCGKRLGIQAIGELAIEMFVTTCLAVDRTGTFLADGNGFFDLSWGIMSMTGGAEKTATVYVVVNENQVRAESFPMAPWDVKADFIVTRNEITKTGAERRKEKKIFWDILPKKRIRKITPLWQLYQQERS